MKQINSLIDIIMIKLVFVPFLFASIIYVRSATASSSSSSIFNPNHHDDPGIVKHDKNNDLLLLMQDDCPKEYDSNYYDNEDDVTSLSFPSDGNEEHHDDPLLSYKFIKQMNGNGRNAGNDLDDDYFLGIGMGGLDGKNGNDGMVVVIYDGTSNIQPQTTTTTSSKAIYFYTGKPQNLYIPERKSTSKTEGVQFIDVKLWGAGGAGGSSSSFAIDSVDSNITQSQQQQDPKSFGGGGGFIQSRIKVNQGETLTILVGGGGKVGPGENSHYHHHTFEDGYIRGGFGGTGIMGGDGGGGGGYSAILRGDVVLAGAGGGGGGGTTDYCCAHGGAGGGFNGTTGSSPKTPLSIGQDAAAEGLVREEFKPADCQSDECVDERDGKGLPAFHYHLDRGFAPNASYDFQSTAGLGGLIDSAGVGGNSSAYKILENIVSRVALPGGFGFGGNGADGKEGGGGGGSGFFGGGGGGSGVDAAGGGGGSGYIDLSSLYKSSVDERNSVLRPIGPSFIKHDVTHNSVEIQWDTGYHSKTSMGYIIRGFEIEMSRSRIGAAYEGGECSDDFELKDYIQRDDMKYSMIRSIEKLYPETVYCVRLISISDRGRSKPSKILKVKTLPLPKNEWFRVYPQSNLDVYKDKRNTDAISDNVFCEVPMKPAPRRGHSLSFIQGKVYLYGGVTKICICNEMDTHCGDKVVYSNEVWSFDTVTRIWKSLQTHEWKNSSRPPGREMHSASLLSNGKLLVIGGRSDSSKTFEYARNKVILGDIWEMDPGLISSHVVSGNETNHLPRLIEDGKVVYHSVDVNIRNDKGYRKGELCVKNVEVELSLEHSCVEEVETITLYGPGAITAEVGVPLDKVDELQLFIGSRRGSHCHARSSKIRFSDSGKESILDRTYDFPESGTFRPAETLASHFHGKQVNGLWTLAVYDNMIDGLEGSIIEWKLIFDVEYCTDGVEWTKISNNDVNSCDRSEVVNNKVEVYCPENCGNHLSLSSQRDLFTPRHSHSAIAVGNDVYVFGGFSQRNIHEVWKFVYETRQWTRLHGTRSRPKWYGRSSALTPFGMISFGGMKIGDRSILENSVEIYDVVDRTTSLVNATRPQLSDKMQIGVPWSRYHTAVCYVGWEHLLFDLLRYVNEFENIRKHVDAAALMFGGHMNLLQNNYVDDMWILSLKQQVHLRTESELKRRRDEACKILLYPSKYENNRWDWTCGVLSDIHSSEPCLWEDVLLMAWCLGQYQSFTSPV